jgi:hypothetical protein
LTKGNVTANAHQAASSLAPAEVISESRVEVVGIRNVGELDADFDEAREIMGIGGLPPGVTDAPDDNGRIGNRRGLRVAYVNPDPNPNDGKREED